MLAARQAAPHSSRTSTESRMPADIIVDLRTSDPVAVDGLPQHRVR
jgi:hypothetical protein